MGDRSAVLRSRGHFVCVARNRVSEWSFSGSRKRGGGTCQTALSGMGYEETATTALFRITRGNCNGRVRTPRLSIRRTSVRYPLVWNKKEKRALSGMGQEEAVMVGLFRPTRGNSDDHPFRQDAPFVT